MGVVVTQVGKLRTNPKMAKNLGIKSLDNNTLYPDAYKINIKIIDLTPNNFNTFSYYLNEGFDSTSLQDKSITSVADKIIEATKDLAGNMKDTAIEITKNGGL